MDRGAWWATVQEVTKNQTQLNTVQQVVYRRTKVHFKGFIINN